MTRSHLTDTLTTLLKECQEQRITVGKLVESMNHKGFGALLLVPATINVLPTGAVPGVPAVCCTLEILLCTQILMGRESPWLPRWLQELSFDRAKFARGVEWIKPALTWLDRMSVRRFEFFYSDIMKRIIAVICILLAAISFPVEFIPLAGYLPASAILAFALGLTMKDGFFTVIGFILAIINLIVIPDWLFW